MRRALAIGAVIAVIGGLGFPSLSAGTVHKPEFTIELPEGWVEVPHDILVAKHAEMQLLSRALIAPYDYSFQPKTRKWLSHPYLLVIVDKSGKIAEHTLRTLPKINVGKAGDSAAGDFAAVMKNAVDGQMQYEAEYNVIWVVSRSELAGVGTVKTVTGMFPTEQGSLQFHGYSTAETFFDYLPYFRQMISSVTPAPDLAYKRAGENPLASASGSWLETAGKILIGLIIAGIVAFVAGVGRKPKQGAPAKR